MRRERARVRACECGRAGVRARVCVSHRPHTDHQTVLLGQPLPYLGLAPLASPTRKVACVFGLGYLCGYATAAGTHRLHKISTPNVGHSQRVT